MTSADIIVRLGRERAVFDRLGVVSLKLFGSLARGTGRAASDADFLVEFSGRADFDRYMDLKFHLEDVLGMRVDLVTKPALHPSMRNAVEREAMTVA